MNSLINAITEIKKNKTNYIHLSQQNTLISLIYRCIFSSINPNYIEGALEADSVYGLSVYTNAH
jgi:hypothetical protein